MASRFLPGSKARKRKKQEAAAAKLNNSSIASTLVPPIAVVAVPRAPSPLKPSSSVAAALTRAGRVVAAPVSEVVGENTRQMEDSLTPKTKKRSAGSEPKEILPGGYVLSRGPSSTSAGAENPNYSYSDIPRPRLASPRPSMIDPGRLEEDDDKDDDPNAPYAIPSKLSRGKQTRTQGGRLTHHGIADVDGQDLFAVSELSSDSSELPPLQPMRRDLDEGASTLPHRRRSVPTPQGVSRSLENLSASAALRSPPASALSVKSIGLGQSLNDVFIPDQAIPTAKAAAIAKSKPAAPPRRMTTPSQERGAYHELERVDSQEDQSGTDDNAFFTGQTGRSSDYLYNTLTFPSVETCPSQAVQLTVSSAAKQSSRKSSRSKSQPPNAKNPPKTGAAVLLSPKASASGASIMSSSGGNSRGSLKEDESMVSITDDPEEGGSGASEQHLVPILLRQQQLTMELQHHQQTQRQHQAETHHILHEIRQLQREQLQQREHPQPGQTSTPNPVPVDQVNVSRSLDDFLTVLAETIANNMEQRQWSQQSGPTAGQTTSQASPPHQTAASSHSQQHVTPSPPQRSRPEVDSSQSHSSFEASPTRAGQSASRALLSPMANWERSASGNHQLDALQEANSLLLAVGQSQSHNPDDVFLAHRLQALFEHIRASQALTHQQDEKWRKTKGRLRRERSVLREENEHLQRDLHDVTKQAAAGQQDAENVLARQESLRKNEREALVRVQQETQIENDRLQRLLESYQSMDSTSALTEKRKNEKLREQLQDYELIVHRQNEHLAYLQSKSEDHRSHEQLRKSGSIPSSSTVPAHAHVDAKQLCPLVIAYDKRLEEKDAFIRKQEAELDRIRKQLAGLREENEELTEETARMVSQAKESVTPGELHALQTQNQLLVEENENLAEQKKLLSKKMKLVAASAKKQVETEHKELVALHKANEKLQADFTDLGSAHHEIRTAHDAMRGQQDHLVAKTELTRLAITWQTRLEEVEETRSAMEESHRKVVDHIEEDKKKLLMRITDLTHQQDILQKQVDEGRVDQVELSGDIAQLQNDLKRAHGVESQLNEHLAAVTAEAGRLHDECDSLRNLVNKEQMLHSATVKKVSSNSQRLHDTKEKLTSVKLKASRSVEQMSVRLKEQAGRHAAEMQEVQRQARYLKSLLEDKQKQIHQLSEDLNEKEEQVHRLVQATTDQHQHLRQSAASLSQHTVQPRLAKSTHDIRMSSRKD